MKWTFPKLAKILKPFMPENRTGKLNQDQCVRILFAQMTNNPEKFTQDVLDPMTSLRQYYSGSSGLRGIAPKIVSCLDKDNFEQYLESFTDSAKSNIAKKIKKIDPDSDIYKTTMASTVTKLFLGILDATNSKQNNENKKNTSTNRVEDRNNFYLVKTVLDQKFDDVFTEIDSSKLGVYNDNGIHIFGLKTDTYPLRYDDLTTLLLENLGRYVFSRLSWGHMQSDGNLETIGIFARKRLKKQLKQHRLTSDKLLGEMLIYIFLEHVERAPKLLTQVEFNKQEIQTDGIFLKVGDDGCQYIIGATQIFNSISGAIDAALTQIKQLDKYPDISPIQLIDSGCLNAVVDNNTSDNLAKVLIPKIDSDTNKPIRSYGIFIGYSFENMAALSNMSKKQADQNFEQQLIKDMKFANKYISREIAKIGLQQRSFYVYMLPFSSAEKAGDFIINEALE